MPQNPNQRRASDAVAAWLAKHHKNPAWLVDAAKADPGTIGDFLNGKRWPKTGTQGRIEDALGWPAGVIRQIGNGDDIPTESLLELTAKSAAGGDVGGGTQDADYVAAPGDRVEGGHTDDEVLAAVRAMRDELRTLREEVRRLAERDQPGP